MGAQSSWLGARQLGCQLYQVSDQFRGLRLSAHDQLQCLCQAIRVGKPWRSPSLYSLPNLICCLPAQLLPHWRALSLLLQPRLSGGCYRSLLVGEQSVSSGALADHTQCAICHLHWCAQLLVLPLLREGLQQVVACLCRKVSNQGRVSSFFMTRSPRNLPLYGSNSPTQYNYN